LLIKSTGYSGTRTTR